VNELLQSVWWAMMAQAPASPPPVVAGAQIESVWDFVVKGGPTMIAIGLCSLVALTIAVERSIVLRRRTAIPPAFMAGLRGVASDRSRALDYCRSNGSPIANLLWVVIRHRGEPREAVSRSVEEAGRREISRLRKRLRVLGALPQVSTMLGLLGTIFGMIKTFQAVAASGQSLGKTELLAKGIFEAWTCTAAGLLVAIPVLVVYHTLMGRAESVAVELDRAVFDWVEEEEPKAAATGAAAAPARTAEPHREAAARNDGHVEVVGALSA
jgi:biopolymer transport protein ExbB